MTGRGRTKGSKTTQFAKGQSGNPTGKVPVDPRVKEIKKFTAEELEQLISVLLEAGPDELERIDADPTAPMIKKIMASILTRTQMTGSMQQLDMVLNRLIGKVKERMEVEIRRPRILVRRNGDEVIFGSEPVKEIDGED
jgi:hypothetical protein